MHFMGGESFSFDGRESAEADVESEETDMNVARANFVEERFGEVKSGGGRCNGARGLCEDGLVASTIGFCFVCGRTIDVGREWNFAKGIEKGQNILWALETNTSMSFIIGFENNGANVGCLSAKIAK